MIKWEVKKMLKGITFFDFIVGSVISTILYFTYEKYAWMFLIGLAVAVINFIIGGILIERVLLKNKAPGIFFVLLKVLRIFLICSVPVIFLKNNTNSILFYMLGFVSHFIAIILYSILNKNSD